MKKTVSGGFPANCRSARENASHTMDLLRADLSESNIVFIHAALDDAGLSLAAFRLYCHLSRRAGRSGIYPAVKSMAATCRINEDTVWRALSELEARGMLERKPRPGRSTEIILQPPSTWRKTGGTGKEGAPPEFRHHPPEKEGHHPPEKEGHEVYPSKGNPSEGNPILLDVPPAVPPKSANVPRKIKNLKPTLTEVVEFTKSLGLPDSDGESCYWKWEGNGWTNGNKPIKDWKATVRSWMAARYLPSQSSAAFPPLVSPPRNPQKKETRGPEELGELLATVRDLYPSARFADWDSIDPAIRSEAEAVLRQKKEGALFLS